MNRRKAERTASFAALALVLLLVPAAPAVSDGSGDYPPPATGDWVITQDTWVKNETVLLKGNLLVRSGNLTLENVTLAANRYGYSIVVNVSKGASLVARDCTMRHGDNSGLVLYLEGRTELRNCTFGEGWEFSRDIRIHAQSPDFILKDCIVEGTVVISDGLDINLSSNIVQNVYEGAILGQGARLSGLTIRECKFGAVAGEKSVLSDCVFENCMIGVDAADRVSVSRCSFANISTGITDFYGPFMFLYNASISECDFTNCSAGIYCSAKGTNVSGCLFRECEWGAVCLDNAVLTGCNFANCADGVLIQGVLRGDRTNCTVEGCTFDTNALSVALVDDASAAVLNSSFVQNGSAGGINWSGGNLTVSGCSFLSWDYVYCLAGEQGSLTVTDSDFQETSLAVRAENVSRGEIDRCVMPTYNGAFSFPNYDPSIACGGDFELRDAAGFAGGNYTPLKVLSGTCRAYNVSGLAGRAVVEQNATLENYWYLDCSVAYPNGSKAPGASLVVADRQARVVYQNRSDERGKVPRAEIIQFSQTGNTTTEHIPYRVNASKDALACHLSVNVTQNLDLTLVLAEASLPWVRILSPANGTLTNSSQVTVTGAAGDDIGLSMVKLRAGAGEWVAADGTSEWRADLSVPDGEALIEAEAVDGAGNAARDSILLTVDTRPPYIIISSPINGALVNTTSIEVFGQVEPGSVVLMDGETVPVSLGTFAAQRPLQEGPNEIAVLARDAAGNSAEVRVSVTRDTLPPGLTLADPRDGQLTNWGVIMATGTVEQGAAVFVNNESASSSGSFFWANVTLLDGENAIIVQAVDAAGNWNSLSVTVFLDRVPPFILVGLSNGTVTRESSLQLSGQVEPGATLSVNWDPVAVGPDGRFRTNLSLHFGLNTVHLVAWDSAGNLAKLDRTITREEESEPPPPGDGGEPSQRPSNLNTLVGLLAMVIVFLLLLAMVARRKPAPEEQETDNPAGPPVGMEQRDERKGPGEDRD